MWLGDLEVKKYVLFAHPSTLDKAISLTVEFEAFEGAHNKTTLKPRNYDHDLISIQSSVQAVQKNAHKTSPSTDKSVLAEIAKTMKDLQSTLQDLRLPNGFQGFFKYEVLYIINMARLVDNVRRNFAISLN